MVLVAASAYVFGTVHAAEIESGPVREAEDEVCVGSVTELG